MSVFIPPTDYRRIKVVRSFDELVSTRFGDGVNALCWERSLAGDFDEIARKLEPGEGITTLDEETLLSLDLSDAGKAARDVLLSDQEMLAACGLSPVLDSVAYSPRVMSGEPIQTDVFSFHADSATVEADTYLCSYNTSCSEGLRNDEAVKYVDLPDMRARLLGLYGGADDEGFAEYLNENFYDLHYSAVSGAQPFSFGIGNIWRIAIEYPGCPVPPCVHRAPATTVGQVPRLLLLS